MLKRISKKLGYEDRGFTIIEVMIVLAVAGLIMVVVLIAIPQLQRNQRNENRRSVASRIVTELNSYAGNNNGNFPAGNVASGDTNLGTPATAAGFFVRYLGCSTTGTQAVTSCTTNINDPRTAIPVGVATASGVGSGISTVAGANATPTLATEAGSIAYATTRVCSGETMTATGANARNFAFQIRLEGGAVYCLDNR